MASTTYVRGSHSYKFGAEMKQDVYTDLNLQGAQGQYTFGNGPTAVPYLQNSSVGGGSIGAGYATFLLGQVTYTNVNAPRKRRCGRIAWGTYAPGQLEDHAETDPRLGLALGLDPLGHELHDREAEIGLHTPNPSAGGLPGGYIFEGYGPGRCNCEFSQTYPYAFGPRLAIAYQINPEDGVPRRLGRHL